MSLNKSKGNMYNWCSHTHSHLGGVCPHECTYCYVDSFRQRVPKYQGKLRFIEKELDINYGSGKTIFIEHCGDLFADEVPVEWIKKILEHCRQFPDNTYVFQTKNPKRLNQMPVWLPPKSICGVTMETNRRIPDIGNAPNPSDRAREIMLFEGRKFVTIEPILEFDFEILLSWVKWIDPEFVNIGADSKNNNLSEPCIEKVETLIHRFTEYGIEIREKTNLDRLRRRHVCNR